MNKLTIAAVDACAPKPFTAQPYLMLTLASQVGTPAAYIQMFPADASMEDIDAEARALEMGGTIDQAALDANWKLDVDAIEAEAAQIEGDAEGVAFDYDGPAPIEAEVIEELEPIL